MSRADLERPSRNASSLANREQHDLDRKFLRIRTLSAPGTVALAAARNRRSVPPRGHGDRHVPSVGTGDATFGRIRVALMESVLHKAAFPLTT